MNAVPVRSVLNVRLPQRLQRAAATSGPFEAPQVLSQAVSRADGLEIHACQAGSSPIPREGATER